jgi:15-cis-phytoene synthase
MSSAQEITKKSQSNLALAFFALPRQRRAAITIFYAFCRHIDDLADDAIRPLDERLAALRAWRAALRGPVLGEMSFAAEMREVIRQYRIDLRYLDDILDGVESDLRPGRFQSFSDLSRYCYRVASAVGLVSIEIFGYRNPRTRRYAYILGHALQLTNIIRDIEVDLRNGGRIYLPLSEIAQYGYSEEQLLRRAYNRQFLGLMQAQAERARGFFREARRLLPREDVRSMVAAELMRATYFRLLQKIEADRFRMFYRRYRLGTTEKLLMITLALSSNCLGIKP